MTSADSVLALAPARSNSSQTTPSPSWVRFEMPIGSALVGLRPEFQHPVAENVHDLRIHDVPYTVSINMAPPCPPPMHSVATPRLVPSRFMALTRCSTMRLPLQPTGWPRLIAPPSTLSLARSISPGGAVEAEDLAAELVVVPGREATQHLGGERFVQFPGLDVLQRQLVALQEFGRRQHRTEAHDAGIERRPLAVDDHRLWRQAMLCNRVFGSQDGPRSAVGDLRRIAGGDLAPGPLEHRLQPGQRSPARNPAARRHHDRRICRRGRRRFRPHP